MNRLHSKLVAPTVVCTAIVIAAAAYADGFKMRQVNSLTKDGGASMAEVEEKYGEPFERVEMAKSDQGCVEAWMYSEVIMKGLQVKAIQVLTVYFDEDGYVCGTYITDGDKLDESRDRES